MKNILGLITTLILFSLGAYAEDQQKHPRVAELEDNLRENASVYLKTRFPNRPFLVNINVEPLRRSTGKNLAVDVDALPYFDNASEEIQDEWDDPKVSLKQLLYRTQKVKLEVLLSSALSDNETAEVKESLMKTLHLIPARDEVQFNFRSWGGSSDRWVYPLIAIGLALLFLCGFFIISRSGVSRIATALKEQKISTATSSGSGSMATLGMPSPTITSNFGSGQTTVRGGVQVNDPIRARELMGKFIDILLKNPNFPTLQSIMILEEYGEKNPVGLGAILVELPLTLQTKLYSFGVSECWFKALNAPGMVSMEEIEVLQRLVRQPDTGRSMATEEMIIKVWRVGPLIPDFLRTYPRDISMTILSHLPKGVAISAARKAFPGAWADLLDPSIRLAVIPDAKAAEISKNAEDIRPLGRLEDFKKQKSESELFEYLKFASPEEEREIYLASKADSMIHQVRPPFYSIFEESDDLLKAFCTRITPDQWAFALFNVERGSRRKIQSFLGEKQSFLLMEMIKNLDRSPPEKERVGEAREGIARLFKTFRGSRETEIDSLVNWANTKEDKKTPTEEPNEEAA